VPIPDSMQVDAGTGDRARSVAVPVDSWDDYLERFGAFEAPGLLPHAVATFFAQGGRRAWVVRIVHDEHGWDGSAMVPFGCAYHDLADPARGDFDQPVVNTADGRALHAGQIVLTGSLVKTVWLSAGNSVTMALDGLGEVSATFA